MDTFSDIWDADLGYKCYSAIAMSRLVRPTKIIINMLTEKSRKGRVDYVLVCLRITLIIINEKVLLLPDCEEGDNIFGCNYVS